MSLVELSICQYWEGQETGGSDSVVVYEVPANILPLN
jgi:hypothetical protein